MIANSDDEFLLTLPSNVVSKTTTPNKPNAYVITLPQPVELDGEWEAALVDVQFLQDWCNFTEPTVLVVGFTPSLTTTEFSEQNVQLFKGSPKTYKQKVLADITELCVSFEYRDVVAVNLPLAFYESTSAYGEFLVKVITAAFAGKKNKPIIKLRRDLLPERYEFECSNGTLEILADNGYAMAVLGMTTAEVYKSIAYPDVLVRRYVFPFHQQNPDQPFYEHGLDNPESVYIYSDVIKYQFVGDVMAPLLGVVPLTAKPGGLQYWCFNPPYYTRLQSNRLHTIDIQLRTDAGNPIHFRSTQSKVVCRLHFRRKHMRI